MDRLHSIITGAGRGIGRAIALRLAREGATVVLSARTMSELETVAGEVEAAGGTGIPLTMDVSDTASVQATMQAACEALDGEVHLLVNNAGIFDVRPIEETDPAFFERMLAVNLTGPFLVTRAVLHALEQAGAGQSERGACIVNISSVAGREGYAGNTAYCASKFGLAGFAAALREDLVGTGIRVETLFPGGTDTSIFDGVPGDWDRASMGRPEDVAEEVWRAFSR